MARLGAGQTRANHERLSSSLDHCSTSSSGSGGSAAVSSEARTDSPSINVTGSVVLSEEWSSELSDEVKLKPAHLLNAGSCGPLGEKTIDGILSSADEQLREAKKFADKLAKRK